MTIMGIVEVEIGNRILWFWIISAAVLTDLFLRMMLMGGRQQTSITGTLESQNMWPKCRQLIFLKKKTSVNCLCYLEESGHNL